MLSFDSAADAINCAVAMQQATDGAMRRAQQYPPQIRVRLQRLRERMRPHSDH